MSEISAKEFKKLNDPRRTGRGYSTLWKEMQLISRDFTPERATELQTAPYLRPMTRVDRIEKMQEAHMKLGALIEKCRPHMEGVQGAAPVDKEEFREAFVRAYHLYTPGNTVGNEARMHILAVFKELKLIKPQDIEQGGPLKPRGL